MTAAGEHTPLVGDGLGFCHVVTLLALTGGLSAWSTVPVHLSLIAAAKAGLTSDGFSKSDISKGQTFYWVGFGVGAALIMPCLDRFGRKLPCLGLLVLGIVSWFLSTLASGPVLYGLATFFVGCSANLSNASNLLMQESIPERFRYTGMVVLNMSWSTTCCLVAVLGSSMTRELSWQAETHLWEIPFALVLLFGLVFLSESPAFVKAQTEVASGGSCELTVLGALQKLLGDPDLRECMWLIMLCWTTNIVASSGINYLSGSLSPNLYTNIFLLSLVNVVSFALSGPVAQWLGPRAQMDSFIVAGAAMIVCSVLPAGESRVVMALVATFFLNVASMCILMLIVDCFPVECRSTAMGAINCVAFTSTMVAPLLTLTKLSAVAVVICSLCLVGAFASWTLGSTPAGAASELLESGGAEGLSGSPGRSAPRSTPTLPA